MILLIESIGVGDAVSFVTGYKKFLFLAGFH